MHPVRHPQRIALVVAVLAAMTAQAQTPPGASLPGRTERDAQREPQPAKRDGAISIDRSRFAEQVPAGAQQTQLQLAEVIVSGNSAVGTAELQSLWQPMLGKTVSLADVFGIAAGISAAYRERGFVLSQAVVLQQDLETAAARVRIQVLEGFIDKTTVSGNAVPGLLAYLAPIARERPATLSTLERQLLLVNELAGVQASGNLKAGSAPNASDLDLSVQRTPIQGSVTVHNRVAPSQGDLRLEGDLTVNGLLGNFDRHNLRIGSSASKRMNQLSYGLELPLGSDGLKLQAGVSASQSEPNVVATNLDTSSRNAYAGLSYPLVRSRQVNVGLRAQLAGYNNSSDTLGLRTSQDHIRAVRVGVTADYADAFGGVNLFDLEYSKGLSGLGASAADDPLLNGAKPTFSRTTVYLARLQHLGGAWTLLGAATVQDSADKLPSAEQLGLGGETFLRGFDPSEAIGERGYAAKLELRFNAEGAPFTATFYAYADAGEVKRRRLGESDLRVSLTSAGVGVRFSGPARTRGFVEIAKPVGDKVASKDSSNARVFAGIGIDF